MTSSRTFLLKGLRALVQSRRWKAGDLAEATGKSRAWLDLLLKGETNFSVDDYDEILSKAFKVPFEFVVSGQDPTTPNEHRDLYRTLGIAIENATATGTLEGLRYALAGILEKTISDRALLQQAEPPAKARREAGQKPPPSPNPGTEGGAVARGGQKSLHRKKHAS